MAYPAQCLLLTCLEISSQEGGLDRKRAPGIPQSSCAQLAMAVTAKRIHHTRGGDERQSVVPGRRRGIKIQDTHKQASAH